MKHINEIRQLEPGNSHQYYVNIVFDKRALVFFYLCNVHQYIVSHHH